MTSLDLPLYTTSVSRWPNVPAYSLCRISKQEESIHVEFILVVVLQEDKYLITV